MEGAPKPQPSFERAGINEAGYPVYNRIAERMEDVVEKWPAPEYESLEKPRQRGRLRLALAAAGALGVAGVSGKAVYDHYSESATEPYTISQPEKTESTGKVVNAEEVERVAPETSIRPELRPSEDSFAADISEAVFEQAEVAKTESSETSTEVDTVNETYEANNELPIDRAVLDNLGYSFGTTAHSTAETMTEYELGKPVMTFDDTVQSFLPKSEAEWQVAVEGFREYADMPTKGAEQYTREEYLREMVTFKEGVPEEVQVELRRLLPALAAQESAFAGDAKSAVGAVGILQFMPETWERYTGSAEVSLSLIKQTEVAGRYLSDIYKTLDRLVGDERWEVLRSKFDSEEAFYKELVAQLVLNAFNAGEGRVIEVVQYYVDSKQPYDMPSGKELFYDITQFGAQANYGKYLAGYGTHSAEYVPKIHARYTLLTEPSSKAEQYAMNMIDTK